MRALSPLFVRIAAASALVPAIAAAQDDAEFARASDALREDVLVLDDGVDAEEVPWETYDAAASYGPRGNAHLGLSLRVGGIIATSDEVPDGVLADLSAFVDIRYVQTKPFRLRIAVAFAGQTYNAADRSGGVYVASSPFSARIRLFPLSIDILNFLTVRAAGEIGIQWAPTPDGSGVVAPFYGASAEIVVLTLDSTLEIGALGGFQFTTVAGLNREWGWQQQSFDAVLGAMVSYVVP
jgi:hypothetical protein